MPKATAHITHLLTAREVNVHEFGTIAHHISKSRINLAKNPGTLPVTLAWTLTNGHPRAAPVPARARPAPRSAFPGLKHGTTARPASTFRLKI